MDPCASYYNSFNDETLFRLFDRASLKDDDKLVNTIYQEMLSRSITNNKSFTSCAKQYDLNSIFSRCIEKSLLTEDDVYIEVSFPTDPDHPLKLLRLFIINNFAYERILERQDHDDHQELVYDLFVSLINCQEKPFDPVKLIKTHRPFVSYLLRHTLTELKTDVLKQSLLFF